MSEGEKRKRGKAPPVWAVDADKREITIRPRKALLEREPKTAGRVAAFDQLHRELAVATEVFLHHGDGGREGVYDALRALTKYLTGQGIPFAALEPIIAIESAIADADRGTASPIFTPSRTPRGGKPPTSDMSRKFEGQLAIVMECCVCHFRAAGKRPFVAPAAQLAAKLINESKWPVRVTARQLEELRERIQQSPKKSADRIQVDAAFKSGVAELHPLLWAEALLAHDWVNPPAKLSE